MRHTEGERITRETSITAALVVPDSFPWPANKERSLEIDTGIPFFDHMLHAFLFHGGFAGKVFCTGDTAVDDHHSVEDTGIVLGQLFRTLVEENGPVMRFGHAVIPMDDALAEAVVDVSNRSALGWQVTFPQERAGTFDLLLVREFFTAFTSEARINLHLISRAGHNGHHVAEALFKAAGRALGAAYVPAGAVLSTKGSL